MREPLLDTLVLTLTEITTGKASALVPIQRMTGGVPAPNSADGNLQIVVGDQINAARVDPNDPSDVALGNIGYGVPTEEPGILVFTDESGNPLPNGSTWDLTKGVVFLKYTDDAGNGWPKTVSLSVSNRPPSGNILTDIETSLMSNKGNGIWMDTIPLMDSHLMITDGNLDIFFQGTITAIVKSHRNVVNVETLDNNQATQTIITAYPNQPPGGIIFDPTKLPNDSTVDRHSDSVTVCVTEQVFSNSKIDTIVAKKVECENSSDVITGLNLIQTQVNSNIFCGTVAKDEIKSVTEINLTDGIISCLEDDNIIVQYEDPINPGDEIEFSVNWNYDVPTSIIIFPKGNPTVVNSAYRETGKDNVFTISVLANNETFGPPGQSDVNDTKTVVVTTASGDKKLLYCKKSDRIPILEVLFTKETLFIVLSNPVSQVLIQKWRV